MNDCLDLQELNDEMNSMGTTDTMVHFIIHLLWIIFNSAILAIPKIQIVTFLLQF